HAVSELGGAQRAQARVADVTDESAVRAAFESAATAFGPIAILVHSAGVAESAPLSKTDSALWQRHIAVNLTGAFFCCKAAEPGMRRSGWGRIVTIAGVAGLRGHPYTAATTASKHGARR